MTRRAVGAARLITEHVNGMHSVLLGIALPVGSSADPPGRAGTAHLCEHLRAVSANSRLAPGHLQRITLEAFTEREETFFLVRALKEDAAILVEWLALFLDPASLVANEFEREQAVVLEETAALECSEIEKIDNAFMRVGYDGCCYSRPVAGMADEIAKLGQGDCEAFIADCVLRGGVVVGLVGDIDRTSLPDMVAATLDGVSPADNEAAHRPAGRPLIPGRISVHTELGMVYFLLGFPAVKRDGPDRGLIHAISAYLGGDIDSLLFRRLRRERALVYSVQSEYHPFRNAGHLVVKGITSNDNFPAVMDCLDDVVAYMRSWAPTDSTAAQLRHTLRKSLLLNLDDPRNKLMRLIKHELWFSEYYSLSDDLAFIESIERNGLARLAANVFGQPYLLCHGA